MSEAVHYRIILAASQAIKGLGLPGVGVEHVWPKLLPTDRNLSTDHGLIVVAPWDREKLEGGNFEDYWTSYPALVLFALTKNQDLTLREPEFGWRDGVIALFRPGKLAGVPEVWRCEVEPQAVVDLARFLESQVLVGAVLFRFWVTSSNNKPG